jgi:hypothetical protein
MVITSSDIAKTKPTRLKAYLRNMPVSAGLMKEQNWSDLAEFLMNLDFDVWQTFDDLEDLDRVLNDIEYVVRKELNEGIFRAHKSTSKKKAYSKMWYMKNRQKLAKKRRALKTNIKAMADSKKKERLKKQRKNLKKKPLKKYPTAKRHSNEGRISFAETVKDLTKRNSDKEDYSNKDKPRYFIPEKSFMINEMKISAGQKFILIGSDLFFEIGGKKLKIDDPVPVIPYLKEI